MDALTVLALAAFGSTAYLATLSAVKWLNQQVSRMKVAGLVVVGMVLCALIGTIANASESVVIGFIVGAGITPPVHRWILQRPRAVAGH
ncbi:hypothetical protein TK78_19995 [Streptomyces sp. Tue 6075]|uniref:hypothetical protein n=1 Tax=Streptomyces sp. Tue 6075 TaxID=1661694 RepID=UPI00094A7C3F|nr:hypothetical protein [Streptomyces sp. Tue 6075]APS20960.1 hypothetical protein TK78_19995 [Streptomyces sp. Tue 6075]